MFRMLCTKLGTQLGGFFALLLLPPRGAGYITRQPHFSLIDFLCDFTVRFLCYFYSCEKRTS